MVCPTFPLYAWGEIECLSGETGPGDDMFDMKERGASALSPVSVFTIHATGLTSDQPLREKLTFPDGILAFSVAGRIASGSAVTERLRASKADPSAAFSRNRLRI